MEERLIHSAEGSDRSTWQKVCEESKKMWLITLPAMLSRVASYGVFVVTQAFIGHISSTELAAYGLLQILGIRFVNGILIGMSSATETLCGQAFDLWPVVKLSVSSGIMLCLELWYNAVLVLLASYTNDSEVAISAFSICLNIATWEFMICLGFLVGASVRVSNELGRGNTEAAQFSMRVNIVTAAGVGVVFWILCLAFGRDLAYVFTSDEEVIEEVSNLVVLLAFAILINSVQPSQSGVAVGSGRQAQVAWVNIISYYVIGVPSGVLLAFVAHLGITGIWIGMMIGRATQTIWLGFMIWRTDWDEQVERASERLNKWLLRKPEDDPGSSAQGRLVEAGTSEEQK
ncbi:hypothetical protein MLD38_007651 [Melastoma candidum]|uniref:Uncharacterized protein n=1 Tax=Melastoma candidum TaxID=119954 RepID=A0ACB9RUU0_9MYRT|nr:hypothetical protein MLD38_007651 [Melastoma candidum]